MSATADAGAQAPWQHLPTTADYDLLLQSRQPQALLQRLRELAPPPGRG
ncbi:MAG TPA: hypothetical protein VM619_05820 [Luteimonas sp.]|nr:hypothetical protein [Luteimonas sp.]